MAKIIEMKTLDGKYLRVKAQGWEFKKTGGSVIKFRHYSNNELRSDVDPSKCLTFLGSHSKIFGDLHNKELGFNNSKLRLNA